MGGGLRRAAKAARDTRKPKVGAWIKWKPRVTPPVSDDTVIDVRYRNGHLSSFNPSTAKGWAWDDQGDYTIAAYRIVRPAKQVVAE